MRFITASTFSQRRSQDYKITTGSREIDQIMAGGVASSSITAGTGVSATGKTQFCHTLAVTCQVFIIKFGSTISLKFNYKCRNVKVSLRNLEGTDRSLI
jgi:replicative DNA helicase